MYRFRNQYARFEKLESAIDDHLCKMRIVYEERNVCAVNTFIRFVYALIGSGQYDLQMVLDFLDPSLGHGSVGSDCVEGMQSAAQMLESEGLPRPILFAIAGRVADEIESWG